MSTHSDGGPAFPGKLPIYGEVADEFAYFGGMTLRDYFAAKAMQALINAKGEPFDRISEVPEYAYEIADAMLAARGAA